MIKKAVLFFILLLGFISNPVFGDEVPFTELVNKTYNNALKMSAALDSSGNRALLVWWELDDNYFNGKLHVLGISTKKGVVKPGQHTVLPGKNNRMQPGTVAWDPVKKKFLVVWNEFIPGPHGEESIVFGMFFNKKGKPAGGTFQILKKSRVNIVLPIIVALNDATGTGSFFLVANYTGHDDEKDNGMYVVTLGSNGKPLPGNSVQITSFTDFSGVPATAQVPEKAILTRDGGLFVEYSQSRNLQSGWENSYCVAGISATGSRSNPNVIFTSAGEYWPDITILQLSDDLFGFTAFHGLKETEFALQLIKASTLKTSRKPKSLKDAAGSSTVCLFEMEGEAYIAGISHAGLNIMSVSPRGKVKAQFQVGIQGVQYVQTQSIVLPLKGNRLLLLFSHSYGAGKTPAAILLQ